MFLLLFSQILAIFLSSWTTTYILPIVTIPRHYYRYYMILLAKQPSLLTSRYLILISKNFFFTAFILLGFTKGFLISFSRYCSAIKSILPPLIFRYFILKINAKKGGNIKIVRSLDIKPILFLSIPLQLRCYTYALKEKLY